MKKFLTILVALVLVGCVTASESSSSSNNSISSNNTTFDQVIEIKKVFKDEPVTLSEENFEKEMIKLIFELQTRMPDLGNRLQRCDILISKSGDTFQGVRYVSGDICGIGFLRKEDLTPESVWVQEFGIVRNDYRFTVAIATDINEGYPIIVFPEIGEPFSSKYLVRVLAHEGFHLNQIILGSGCTLADTSDCFYKEEEAAFKSQFTLLEEDSTQSGPNQSIGRLSDLALKMEQEMYSRQEDLGSYLREIGYKDVP